MLQKLWYQFWRCRQGGAVLYGGFTGVALMASVGATMTNLAWQEAQWEEIRAALRSSLSMSMDMLGEASTAAGQTALKKRVAELLTSLMPGLKVDSDDVTVAHRSDTGITTVTIGGTATYQFENLWGEGDTSAARQSLPNQTISAQLAADTLYEVAIAADMTSSMRYSIPDGDGNYIVKAQALRNAISAAIDLIEERNEQAANSVLAAVVPYGQAVNVADTSGAAETAAKKRYARMLAGVADTDSRAANTTRHWVDMFHDYGAGQNMGELQYRTLPLFRTTSSWNFHAAETVDISAQAPGFPSWSVQGKDFWNGCVMARWGAYWDEDARPQGTDSDTTENNLRTRVTTVTDTTTGDIKERTEVTDLGTGTSTVTERILWDADAPDSSNWPARADVDGWTPASNGLTNEPLHLSDAPPDIDDPHTRFTAYSWPDARVRGSADGRLEALLVEMLHPGTIDGGTQVSGSIHDKAQLEGSRRCRRRALERAVRDNDWSMRGRSDPSTHDNLRLALERRALKGGDGATGCPPQPILPLTRNVATLRSYAAALEVVDLHQTAPGGTLQHLGMVWGLRALSPLWQDVWSVSDGAGTDRPLRPCAPGETGTHCKQNVRKLILLIADGGIGLSVAPHKVGSDMAAQEEDRLYAEMRFNLGSSQPTDPPWTSDANLSKRNPHYQRDTASLQKGYCYLTETWAPDNGKYERARAATSASAFNNVVGNLTGIGNLSNLLNSFDQTFDRGSTASTAQRNQWTNAFVGLTAWDLFRGNDSKFLSDGSNVIDALMSAGGGWDGRPQGGGAACRLWSPFTAYGRVGDKMQIGGAPVEGVAPFAMRSAWPANARQLRAADTGPLALVGKGWLDDACRLAKERGVEVRAIFIGVAEDATASVNILRSCIREAGGTPDHLYTTPNAAQLKAAMEQVIQLGTTLRFLN